MKKLILAASVLSVVALASCKKTEGDKPATDSTKDSVAAPATDSTKDSVAAPATDSVKKDSVATPAKDSVKK